MDQRTEEWHAARLGKVTASRIADLMAKGRTGAPSASRENYKAQLVCERLTGFRADAFSSTAMQWGTETEPQARATYTLTTGRVVEEVGFIPHPTIQMCGASPDGCIDGGRGLVEIKCPNSATHIATLLGKPPADSYVKQMQWQMACVGADWCDFASFDPRLPDEMQLHIQRIAADYDLQREIEKEVVAFLAEVESEVRELRDLYMRSAA